MRRPRETSHEIAVADDPIGRRLRHTRRHQYLVISGEIADEKEDLLGLP
jgi:hypothetical protein